MCLENLLKCFNISTDPEVQKAITQLQACFGKYKEFGEEVMEDDSEIPSPLDHAEINAFYNSSMKQLEGLVDCLFEILPSIDRLRQVWLLDLERRSHMIAASLPELTAISNSKLHKVVRHDKPFLFSISNARSDASAY
jgi:hypothetical protein